MSWPARRPRFVVTTSTRPRTYRHHHVDACVQDLRPLDLASADQSRPGGRTAPSPTRPPGPGWMTDQCRSEPRICSPSGAVCAGSNPAGGATRAWTSLQDATWSELSWLRDEWPAGSLRRLGATPPGAHIPTQRSALAPSASPCSRLRISSFGQPSRLIVAIAQPVHPRRVREYHGDGINPPGSAGAPSADKMSTMIVSFGPRTARSPRGPASRIRAPHTTCRFTSLSWTGT